MVYENPQYEETIDLLALAASALRKWKWLLLAALIGALLLGLYKGVLHPEKVGGDTEIEELQKALNDNMTKLTTNEAQIVTNQNGIADRQGKIVANQELLVTQQELRDTLEATLTGLRTSLERSQEVLADPDASADQTAAVIMQMLTLTDDIRDTNTELNSAATRVSNTQKEISTWQSEIDNMTASNKTLEDSNANLRTEIEKQETKMEGLTSNDRIGPALKYAVIGAFLGAVVFCGVIFLQFILNKKLRTSDELKEQYGFPILGEFSSAAVKDHNKFDQMLDQLVGDVQTLPEEEQVYKLIAAGIQTPASPLPMQLVVTGTVEKEVLQEVGNQLNGLLPEDYKITGAVNPVYNPGLLAKLKEYTILLVEQKGVSDKREIAKLAEVLRRNEVVVVGAVVL